MGLFFIDYWCFWPHHSLLILKGFFFITVHRSPLFPLLPGVTSADVDAMSKKKIKLMVFCVLNSFLIGFCGSGWFFVLSWSNTQALCRFQWSGQSLLITKVAPAKGQYQIKRHKSPPSKQVIELHFVPEASENEDERVEHGHVRRDVKNPRQQEYKPRSWDSSCQPCELLYCSC